MRRRVIDPLLVYFSLVGLGTLSAASPAVCYKVATVAGGQYAGDGRLATQALLDGVNGLAMDKLGNLYIAETGAHRVRKVDASGRISTLAGTGEPGFAGDGGAAAEAKLYAPYGLAVDSAGDLYIADLGNGRVRRVRMSTGKIATVAGGGDSVASEVASALQLKLFAPRNVAFGADGSLYISDFDGHTVWRVLPDGQARRFAGRGTRGFSGDQSNAAQAELAFPSGIAVAPDSSVYIADSGNRRIRKVSQGVIWTVPSPEDPRFPWILQLPTGLALNPFLRLLVADDYPITGYSGTPQTSVRDIVVPGREVLCTATGDVYFASGGQVWKVDARGVLSLAAGMLSASGYGDGLPATRARLFAPSALAVDSEGNWFVADATDHRVRKITVEGRLIETIAGLGEAGIDTDSLPGTSSRLNQPRGLALGADGQIYVADSGNHRVAVLDVSGTLKTFAGTGIAGMSGLKGPAGKAQLNAPHQLALSRAGELYIADTGNNRVVVVRKNGVLEPAAGDGTPGFSGDGGPATAARLLRPRGVAVAGDGSLYIADSGNRRIRKVSFTGTITTLPLPSEVTLVEPCGIAIADGDSLLVTDCGQHSVFLIQSPAQGSRIAGTGGVGFSGDGGDAAVAAFHAPAAVAPLADGSLLVADTGNGRLRKLMPSNCTAPPAQEIFRAAVVNAASYAEGPIAPGEILAIFVSGTPDSGQALNWSVRFDGREAFLYGATSTQINVQAPFSLAGQSKTRLELLLGGSLVWETELPVVQSSPGLFTDPSQPGQALAVHPDGKLNSQFNPAFRGQWIILYATGLGATDPPQPDGVPAGEPLARVRDGVEVTIGGRTAEVERSGCLHPRRRARGSHHRGEDSRGVLRRTGAGLHWAIPDQRARAAGFLSPWSARGDPKHRWALLSGRSQNLGLVETRMDLRAWIEPRQARLRRPRQCATVLIAADAA